MRRETPDGLLLLVTGAGRNNRRLGETSPVAGCATGSDVGELNLSDIYGLEERFTYQQTGRGWARICCFTTYSTFDCCGKNVQHTKVLSTDSDCLWGIVWHN
jgi:hypothetical protein